MRRMATLIDSLVTVVGQSNSLVGGLEVYYGRCQLTRSALQQVVDDLTNGGVARQRLDWVAHKVDHIARGAVLVDS